MNGVISEGQRDLRCLRVPGQTSDNGRGPVSGAGEAADQVVVGNLGEKNSGQSYGLLWRLIGQR